MSTFSAEQRQSLRMEYDRLLPTWREATSRLLTLLHEVYAQIEDQSLVRARIEKPRIKSFESICRKLLGDRPNKILRIEGVGDIVGARIVCNNNEDVYRFVELLREHHGLQISEVEDYIDQPQTSGYRSVHVNARIELMGKIPFLTKGVACEIQIRTLLQHAWAELTHDDVYKGGEGLPLDLRERTQDLATIISTADGLAQRIRSRLTQEITVKAKVDLSTVTSDGIAFLFSSTFGRSPKEYGIRLGLNAAEEEGLATLVDVESLLSNSTFRVEARKQYHHGIRNTLDPDNETILIAAIKSAAKDRRHGLAWLRQQGRSEWEDADRMWRSEVLLDMPESTSDFIEWLNDYPLDEEKLSRWADGLGALKKCWRCGQDILDVYDFSEALSHYYGDDQEIDFDSLTRALSGISFPSHYEHSHLCPGCGEDWTKD